MILEVPEIPPPDILGITLFGSTARGDADEWSDIDIFLLLDDVSIDRMSEYRRWCSRVLGVVPETITTFSKSSAEAMAAAGSLLLWHLKLEGHCLFQSGRAMEDLLASLVPFEAFATELESYSELVDDVAQACIDGRGPTELDLHVLQVVIRNACILLTVFFGAPTFGRMSAVEAAIRLRSDLPVDMDTYRTLCTWHLLFVRGGEAECRVPSDPLPYIAMARSILIFVTSITC